MKTVIFISLLILAGIFWLMGHSDWHLKRNGQNLLPKGNLTRDNGDFYLDAAKRIWELQPAIKNKFHQPDQPVSPPKRLYPGLKNADIKYNPDSPNLKFLSANEKGGSYEAILQPNGEYLTTGPKQGTYNYGHPSGIWGSIKHLILDVIPHFICGDYE